MKAFQKRRCDEIISSFPIGYRFTSLDVSDKMLKMYNDTFSLLEISGQLRMSKYCIKTEEKYSRPDSYGKGSSLIIYERVDS